MTNSLLNFGKYAVAVSPFVVVCFGFIKLNLKKEIRCKQFIMPVIALLYSIVSMIFVDEIVNGIIKAVDFLQKWIPFLDNVNWNYWMILIGNMAIAVMYGAVKGVVLPISAKIWEAIYAKNSEESTGVFYQYNLRLKTYVLKDEWGHLKYLYRGFYLAAIAVSGIIVILVYSFPEWECFKYPCYPIFGVICLGEVVFYLSGLTATEYKKEVEKEETDDEEEPMDFSGLKEKYRYLFGNRILNDQYEERDEIQKENPQEIIEQLLSSPENQEKAFGKYLNREIRYGNSIDEAYILSARSLMRGESILFANPFYRDLTPCIYFPFNLALLRQGKGLIIVSRHGIEDEIKNWATEGFESIIHVPSFWKVDVLSKDAAECDIGILSYKDIYNMGIMEANQKFLKEVSFVIILEPSQMVASGQVALNMLAKRMETPGNKIVYCACDQNVDGLVDSLSHILKTNITEVRATVSSAKSSTMMFWKADGEYMQHRLFKDVLKYLGGGTSIAAVALKHGIPKMTWYSDKLFPAKDIRWIVGQYYEKICRYIGKTVSQESIQNSLEFSNNIWNVPIEDDKCVIVEDEYYNLYEIGRQFATRGRKQSFVNVLTSNYMLRDYMSNNARIFKTDPKAIPQICADYTRTKRNIILQLIMMMAEGTVSELVIRKELAIIGLSGEITREYLEQLISEYYDIRKYRIVVSEMPTEDIYDEYQREMITSRNFSIRNEEFIKERAAELQNAYYLAEDDVERSHFLGGRLLGHIYQSYIVGQFHCLAGKYYEVVSINKTDGQLKNAVIVRRASDHINDRKYYRQLRTYTLNEENWKNSEAEGAQKRINGILVSSGFIDVAIHTDGYLEMNCFNDIKNAVHVEVNNVPERVYRQKQVLKIKLPDTATPQICFQTCVMLNEIFRTVYPHNYDYITAITDTKALENLPKGLVFDLNGNVEANTIYIVEDSQLDMGLVISVERNLKKFLEIVCDYSDWLMDSLKPAPEEDVPEPTTEDDIDSAIDEVESGKKKHRGLKGLIQRIIEWFKKIFGKFKKKKPENSEVEEGEDAVPADEPVEEPADEPVEEPTEEPADEPVEEPTEESTEESTDESAEESTEESADASEHAENAYMHKIVLKADVENNGTTIDGEDEEVVAVGGGEGEFAGTPAPENDKEQLDCYLYYGYGEFNQNIDPKAIYDFYEKLGFADNAFKKTRKCVSGVKDIEDHYVPNAPGKHYCDFCARDMSGMNYDILKDGRERCQDCSATSIGTVKEFKEIYKRVLNDMEAYYGININVPIAVRMVNTRELSRILKRRFKATAGYDARCVGVAIKSANGYTLVVENGAPKVNAIETISHELTHIWQYTQWDKSVLSQYKREAELFIYEGMAEWASIQYLILIGEEEHAKRQEMITLQRKDEYGIGFALYLKQYPFSWGQRITKDTPFKHPKKPL